MNKLYPDENDYVVTDPEEERLLLEALDGENPTLSESEIDKILGPEGDKTIDKVQIAKSLFGILPDDYIKDLRDERLRKHERD